LKGKFIVEPEEILRKLQTIKAFVFDWDGVFNGGQKDEHGSSPFNEVDAMGTNLLRFNHYLRNGEPPITAIITGERNKAALKFATREHLAAVYCGIKFKADALKDLCHKHNIQPSEVCFMFDDILDFSAAEICGLRIMVNRDCNPLMVGYAVENNLVDYLTKNDGSNYAIREVVELLTGISGRYNDTMSERANFTETYQQYLAKRNEQYTQLYTVENKQIIPIDSL
jgi:3-deoxy-D-manno-octulosonate 8-phosphate phosphatase (KDO 8-P phosphatase)